MSAVVLSLLFGLATSDAGPTPDPSQTWAARYEAAASAYARGEPKVASAELWALVHTLDHPSWQLWVDAALAAHSAGEHGRAIAAARQALRQRPLHRLAIDTHEAAERARGDATGAQLAPPAVLATLGLGPAEHLWLLLALYALSAFTVGAHRFMRATWARVALTVLLTTTTLVAASYLVRRLTTESTAVVVDPSATARMGPSLDALTRFELREAEVTEWLEVRDDFVRVRAANRGEGWVPRAAVELIDR